MTISCCKWLKTAIHGGKTCGRLLLSRRMMMMNFKAKTSRVTGHTISIGVKTLKTLLHIALTRISLWKMLLFKLQFYQLGWFGAFGVEDTNMEDDELKVYLKWTLHVLIYCTQLHIERSLLLFSDMHIRQKFQWTSEQLKSLCCTYSRSRVLKFEVWGLSVG